MGSNMDYNYAFYRKLVKMSQIRLLGGPPRLLEYYMEGGGLSGPQI